MKVRLRHGILHTTWGQSYRRMLSVVLLGAALTACSGGDDPDPTQPESGPIIVGTGVTERSLASNTLEVKASSGEKETISVDDMGNFNEEVEGSGPFLSRLDLGNDDFLYGIGFENNNNRVNQNIHSYSDLIIRNWFEINNRDLDADFEGSGAISLPTEAEVNAIQAALTSLLALVMEDYGVADANLLTDTPNTSVTNFILQNPVIVNNTTVNIIVNNDVSGGEGTQSVVSEDLDLGTDLTEADTENPSAPMDVRAIASGATEIVIVWSPATDNVGVAAYQVFRDGTDIGETPYPVFTDSVSAGASHVYTIIAVDAAGNMSVESIGATGATSDSTDTTAPPAPTSLTLSPSTSAMNLSWQQSSIDDVAGFEVYGATQGSTLELLATVTSTFMTDTSVASGTNYCYEVVAVDASGNTSAPTAEQCASTTGVIVGPTTTTDDPAEINFAASTYSATERESSVTITVRRQGSSTEAISVDYAVTGETAVDGEDFTATSGNLEWAAGDNSERSIIVQLLSDQDDNEGDETFIVTLSNPSSNAMLGSVSETTVTISDVTVPECITEIEVTLIEEDTTLNASCYLVNSNLDVRTPANLTIEAGVTLKFSAGSQMIIRQGASLTAEGTSANPILLTGQDPTPGFWDGLHYSNSVSISNVLDHVTIEYGGSSQYDANLSTSDAQLSVSNTTLRHSGSYGFDFDAGTTLNDFTAVTSTMNVIAGLTSVDQLSAFDATSSFTGNENDYVEVSTEPVMDDTTWGDIGVNWLTEDIDVRASLRVTEGTEIQFESGGAVIVRSNGNMTTEGEDNNPVVLRGKEETPGYWDGVLLSGADGAINTFRHTVISDAGSGQFEANLSSINGSRLDAENLTLSNGSGDGFSISGSSSINNFTEVTSTGNQRAGAIETNLYGQIGSVNSFTGNTEDYVQLTGTVISDAQTWQTTGVPIVFDDIDIREALTVSPGVTLIGTNEAEIIVRNGGSLRAEGTVSEPITFTGEQAINGYWSGIYFNSANSVSNVMDHVVVEYGGFGATAGNVRATCNSASAIPTLTLSNTMLNNGGGFGLYSGSTNCNFVFGENVTFTNNTEGASNIDL